MISSGFGNGLRVSLVYHYSKAYYILDEVLLAGELQESSKKTVSKVIVAQDTLVENTKNGLLEEGS